MARLGDRCRLRRRGLPGGNCARKLRGVDDRDAAAALAGQWIGIARAQLPTLPDGEYYWHDLLGLAVLTDAGDDLGVVDHIIETGANDVLAVRHAGGERLLPWSPDVVGSVDLAGGRIYVRWDADYDDDDAAGTPIAADTADTETPDQK